MDLTLNIKRLARHWALALPVLLVAAALGIAQFNRYTPSRDEFFSMHRAGFLVDGPYAPGELIENLWNEAPDHVPGFFLLLSAWGNLVSSDVAMLRLPGIFAALLSLALAYRLTRDFVAPAAGLAGLLIVACNAHYNFYYDHIRMYSCVVFMSGCVLWLYLRMTDRRQAFRARRFVAFALAVAALLGLHLINAFLFLAALCAYHLLFARKDRGWWSVPLALVLALLCLSPALLAVATAGLQSWEARDFSHTVVDGLAYARGHALSMLNHQPGLGLAALLSLLFVAYKRRKAGGWLIWILGLAALLLFFGLLQQFGLKHMRYSLSLLMPFALFMAAGLHALPGRLRWLAPAILILYMAGGLTFQTSEAWRLYLAWGRVDSLFRLPIHRVSELALKAALKPQIYIYTAPDETFYWLKSYHNYSEKDYFFARHGISAQRISQLEAELSFNPLTTPAVWIAHQPSHGAPDMALLNAIMRGLGYQVCRAHDLLSGSDLLRYSWRALDCAEAEAQVSGLTEALAYDFFGARTSQDGEKLYFVDRWHAVDAAALEGLNMSQQLISPAGENVAQLDLPLRGGGQLQQFAIDISGLAAGQYRLMAIVYDAESGERLPWRGGAGTLEVARVTLT